jgi:cytosine/adenosine deaminase-related metal-dependent hydrolase
MTTQATHTPGPWEIGSINKRDKNLWWAAVFTPKNTGKFHTPRAGEALGVDREECEGNARLIASAPEMLEALRAMVARAPFIDQSVTEDGLANCEALLKARRAIRHAEGEQ